VKEIIRRFNLPVFLMNTKGTRIENMGYKGKSENRNFRKCKGRCQLCYRMGDKFGCESKNVVYEYECKRCGDKYVGKTCNGMYERHAGHKADLKRGDESRGPLGEHERSKHGDENVYNIDNYNIRIVRSFREPVETAIGEALLIESMKPKMNRKSELPKFVYGT
jgi:hypothetical protein